MYKVKIEKILSKTIVDLGFIKPTDPLLSISEKSQFGDYSSNIPLQLSKQKHQKDYQNPLEIANAIIEKLGHPEFLERVEVAGAGFLNFFIKDSSLAEGMRGVEEIREIGKQDGDKQKTKNQKRIIVEYCDPNTHKMLHIGHLLPLTLGESLARLLEYQGHEICRINYGSDIGLTVGKSLWGIGKLNDEYKKAKQGSLREKVEFLGKAYSFAHAEYEKSLEKKEEIDHITNKLYQRDSSLISLWEETKEWSLGYFELVYSLFNTLFDKRINESEVDEVGKKIVLENVGRIFVKDAGAVIFPGEKYGLHNRVFINSKGNPTYEGKEVGLAQKYQEIFHPDELRLFSDKAQDDYFDVVIKANEMVFPNILGKVKHYSYGTVGLTTGKMSSRSGNIISAQDLIETVKEKINQISPQLDQLSIQKLAIGAIKFAFLKYSVSSDIVYDVEESVSVHGDTGPYVMYVYARIISILRKVTGVQSGKATENRANLRRGYGLQTNEDSEANDIEIAQEDSSLATRHSAELKIKKTNEQTSKRANENLTLEPEERELLRHLEYFEFIIEKATDNFQPNEIVKYLLNLCKAFNLFYEKIPVLGSKQEEFRLELSKKVAENIKIGLYLLGIETVDKM